MAKATNTKELMELLNGPPSLVVCDDENRPTTTAILVADTHCQLGECILYNDETNEILWTDIYDCKLYKLGLPNINSSNSSNDDGYENKNENDYQLKYFSVPKMLCAFSLLPSAHEGGKYLCAWQDGFEIYNIENPPSSTRDVATDIANSNSSIGENVAPLGLPTRLNDGRCDNEGRRFICGGYFGENVDATMKVFKVESKPNKTITHGELYHLENQQYKNNNTLQVTNSICFSPSGDTMYLADSPTHSIYKYHYHKDTGILTNKALLINYSNLKSTTDEVFYGVPDGSCCDSEGYIWNAVWRDGAGPSYVNRIHPTTGDIVFVVKIPYATSQASCCCFGGKDLDILFITTASVGRDPTLEPKAGGLYAVKVPYKGRKEARFHF